LTLVAIKNYSAVSAVERRADRHNAPQNPDFGRQAHMTEMTAIDLEGDAPFTIDTAAHEPAYMARVSRVGLDGNRDRSRTRAPRRDRRSAILH